MTQIHTCIDRCTFSDEYRVVLSSVIIGLYGRISKADSSFFAAMRFIRKGFSKIAALYALSLIAAYTVWICIKLSIPQGTTSVTLSNHPMAWFMDDYMSLNISSNLRVAHSLNWVGFPELKEAQCADAFSGRATNDAFPGRVTRIYPRDVIDQGTDCHYFIQKFGFHRYPNASEEELYFPIAFSILLYRDIDQVIFLLRAIYHSHNIHCLHVDSKSSVDLLMAAQTLARCLPNVFVLSKLEHIVYSGFSRLQAELTCMKDLLEHPVKWHYMLNLPGQQFPLMTNLEMVRILKLFNGSNDIEGITNPKRMLKWRYEWKHEYLRDKVTGKEKIVRSNHRQPEPPHGLTVVKGSAYGTFSRAFVNFLFRSIVARDFLEWTRTILSPDEYYWATLHHSRNLSVPGGYIGAPEKKPWLSTYALWAGDSVKCAAEYVRQVCIFSPADLPILMTRKEFFANKFNVTRHPATLHCLDEVIFHRTSLGLVRNLSFYENLPFLGGC